MSWDMWCYAPLVYTVMVPFWFLHGIIMTPRGQRRQAVMPCMGFAWAAATVVWFTLYCLPTVLWGWYEW